jgi:DNA-binding Lrp family transcriptional regulator
MRFDKIDHAIIKLVQEDLPLAPRPFYHLAQSLEISEGEIVDRIEKLTRSGIIRRWGAVLRHQQAGFTANAMVAWQVAEVDADEAGHIMSQYAQVSHCYLRRVPAEFGYNLFAMFHAHSDLELRKLVEEVAEKTGIQDYAVITSLKEFKKVSMRYV